jgi:hypothetical protein
MNIPHLMISRDTCQEKMFQHLPYYHYRKLCVANLVDQVKRTIPRYQVLDIAETILYVTVTVNTHIEPESADWIQLRKMGATIVFLPNQNVTDIRFAYPSVYLRASVVKFVLYFLAAVVFVATTVRLLGLYIHHISL